MPEEKLIVTINQNLESKCFAALRLASEFLAHTDEVNERLSSSIECLEYALFYDEQQENSAHILDSYLSLMHVLDQMENRPINFASLRPIGLQVATANEIAPIHLEWNYFIPDSTFVIEYALFEEKNQPHWKVFSETRSTSLDIRGLQLGKSYWFRISALAPTAKAC